MNLKKVILANVGTRNLLHKRPPCLLANELGGASFRAFTKELLDDPHILKEWKVNILNSIVEQFYDEELEHIYLFTSNQINEKTVVQERDTLYAGHLVSRILQREYPLHKDKITPIELTGVKITSPDELIPTYVKHIQELSELHDLQSGNVKLIVSDSGGTPQQKSSLRLVVDFYLEKDQYELWQVNEERDLDGNLILGEISKPRELKQKAYFRLIAERQVLLLVSEGNYEGALRIWTDNRSEAELGQDETFKVLQFNYLRFYQREEDAKGLCEEFDRRRIKKLPTIHDYKLGKVTGNWESWRLMLDAHAPAEAQSYFFKICEAFEVASFYWCLTQRSQSSSITQKPFLTQSVLAWQIFVETAAQNMVRILNGTNADLYRANSNTWYNGPKQLCNNAKTLLNSAAFSSSLMGNFIDSLSRTQGKQNGLNKIRNVIANQGKGHTDVQVLNQDINESQVERNITPIHFDTIIQNWAAALGIQMEEGNVFVRANQEIRGLMNTKWKVPNFSFK